MKKTIAIMVTMVAVLLVHFGSVLAGGIVTKQTLSGEYLRTFSRNGATDAADIAYYNPAGVMKMENGTFINVCGIYTAKEYTNLIGGQAYSSDTPSIGPSFYGLYKKEKWAGFVGFNVPGGGGKVEFDKGSATTFYMAQQYLTAPGSPFDTLESMQLDANSYYYGYLAGAAYAINEKLSIAGGIRYVDATKEADGTIVLSGLAPATAINLSYEQTADGVGGFFGVNLAAFEKINIGLRYETAVKLDFKNNLKNDDTGGLAGIRNGAKTREDLPGLLGIGVFYKLNPKLLAAWSTTFYLEKMADWEGRLADEGNSWESALALEYDITPKFRASCGYMITRLNMDADAAQPEAPELDVKTLCGGIRYIPMEFLTLNFGIAKSIYDPETNASGVGLDKMAPAIGLGVEFKF